MKDLNKTSSVEDVERVMIGSRLKEERKRIKKSRPELAKYTGFSERSIQYYESGETLISLEYWFCRIKKSQIAKS